MPGWWVLPVGSAIATAAFWLGRRSKPSAERFADETSNGSKSPNGSAELPVSDRVSELSALAKNNHHHSSVSDRD
ncbi:MAG TPA: hypothetical protein DCE56_43045 [Cyanobacteria bacterium UBA8553]|nr:hypothetical protein [Cyanobacteria bacterium UBA8553]